jgi:hypothetical protein
VLSISQGKEPDTGKPFENSELSPSWVKYKKKLAKLNKPAGSGALGKKAKQVFTGEWLKSFRHFIVRDGDKKKIEIKPTGRHAQYKGLKGEPIGEKVTNEEIGREAILNGRDWRGISHKTMTLVVAKVRSALRRLLKT